MIHNEDLGAASFGAPQVECRYCGMTPDSPGLEIHPSCYDGEEHTYGRWFDDGEWEKGSAAAACYEQVLSHLDDLRDWLTDEIENGHGARRDAYQLVEERIEQIVVPAMRATVERGQPAAWIDKDDDVFRFDAMSPAGVERFNLSPLYRQVPK